MNCREIGGYFGLECGRSKPYHANAFALSSGCAGLRLIIRTLHISAIHVPEFTCPVVWDAIRLENCECLFYKVGKNFLPSEHFPRHDYVLYNNYFGICANQTREMVGEYPNVIIDNAQAFYMPNCGLASIYSPHKFFGVPDGGFLYSEDPVEMPTDRALSWQKCIHLLKRHDLGANAGYDDFKKVGKMIQDDGVSKMSFLTEALLGNVDYDFCRCKRIDNFLHLHKHLECFNKLRVQLSPEDVPMVYPFLPEQCGLREKLIKSRVYVAQYWPGIPPTDLTDIIPLPIDQRYGKREMDFILDLIL